MLARYTVITPFLSDYRIMLLLRSIDSPKTLLSESSSLSKTIPHSFLYPFVAMMVPYFLLISSTYVIGFMHFNYISNIVNEDVQDLAIGLRGNRSLTALDLSRNGIEDQTVPALCALLEKNIALRKLNISSNFLSAEGVRSLAQALSSNIGSLC